jgi:hypothetical protein
MVKVLNWTSDPKNENMAHGKQAQYECIILLVKRIQNSYPVSSSLYRAETG